MMNLIFLLLFPINASAGRAVMEGIPTIGSTIFVDTANAKVGISTGVTTSTLTVNGVIESVRGGYKFPDGTIQTTAASAVTSITSTVTISAISNAVSNTANAGCNIAGSTVTLAACGSSVKLKYSATLYGDSGTANQRVFVNATMDSLAFPGFDYANAVPMRCTVASAANTEGNCSFNIETAAPQTNASHTFCIGIVNASGANTLNFPAGSGKIVVIASCDGN